MKEIEEQKEYIEKVKKINESKDLKYYILTMGCQLNENDSEKLCGIIEEMGYKPVPRFNEKRSDIVQTIEFGDKEKLIKYCQGIQMGSPIDSNSIPEPWDMPGYTDQVIMAAGAFTQGSSIELSCDAPIRPPYIAFMQGGLTYEYGKLGVMRAISQIL